MVEHIKSGTRFALLGYLSDNQSIVSAFEALDIPLQTPNLPFKESYDAASNSADIFILQSKEKFDDIRAYIESCGDNGSRLLNIEKYCYTFEPTRLFLERNILNECIK